MATATHRRGLQALFIGVLLAIAGLVAFVDRVTAQVSTLSLTATNTETTTATTLDNPISNAGSVSVPSSKPSPWPRDADWSVARAKRDSYFAKQINSQISQIGISVSSVFADDLDPTVSTSPDSIGDIQFYIRITNATANNVPLLSIPTGIREGTLNYVRVEGATGYRWINGELVLQYVSLLPDASTVVTVTGLPLISSDSVQIALSPSIRNQDGTVLAQAPASPKQIVGKLLSLNGQFHGMSQVGLKGNTPATSASTATPSSP
jgi:hypothetical protein